jgi:hypothetical protein
MRLASFRCCTAGARFSFGFVEQTGSHVRAAYIMAAGIEMGILHNARH